MPGLTSEMPGPASEIPGLTSEMPGPASERHGPASERPGLASEGPYTRGGGLTRCPKMRLQISHLIFLLEHGERTFERINK